MRGPVLISEPPETQNETEDVAQRGFASGHGRGSCSSQAQCWGGQRRTEEGPWSRRKVQMGTGASEGDELKKEANTALPEQQAHSRSHRAREKAASRDTSRARHGADGARSARASTSTRTLAGFLVTLAQREQMLLTILALVCLLPLATHAVRCTGGSSCSDGFLCSTCGIKNLFECNDCSCCRATGCNAGRYYSGGSCRKVT